MKRSKLCEAIQYAVDRGTTEHVTSWSPQVEQGFEQVEVTLRSALADKPAESQGLVGSRRGGSKTGGNSKHDRSSTSSLD